MTETNNKFHIAGVRVIYAYTLNDATHRDLYEGHYKIAERILHLTDDELECGRDDASYLEEKIRPELPAGAKLAKIWLGLASTLNGEVAINARQIYDLAEQRGIPQRTMREGGVDVWFKTDVAQLDSLIAAAIGESSVREQRRRDKEYEELSDTKKKKKTVKASSSRPKRAIRFRPEQEDAIARTISHFANGGAEGWKPRFLWNAKMRFGKTLSALEVAKQRGYKSVLIITHRPVVDDGWHEDFEKIYFDKPNYKYGSRNINDDDNINDFRDLTRQTQVADGGFVFFVSMQYLRLSKLVGGKEKKKNEEKEAILNYPWELVVIDEAHEGTKSDVGSNVMRYLWLDTPDVASESQEDAKKAKRAKRTDLPHTLSLSGTPFNLYGDFAMTEIFTWDYVAEQEAKARWHEKNGDDPNPYDVLPRMHIFNHDIEGITGRIEEPGAGKAGGEFDDDELDETKAGFSFSRFFQIWTGKPKTDKALMPSPDHQGRFMHEAQVMKFFHTLAVGTEEGSNYPFSTDEFRDSFHHTFWMLPGVEQAKALKNLLEQETWTIDGEEVENPYYGGFRVINVAGSGDEDQDSKALRAVKKGIMDADRDGLYTITLSCGKLTTGVSIPQWTAVFYLKGNDDTRASAYLQTIFRVQTPAVINGKQKTDAYVFDFSPTRSLRVFAEAVKLNVATRTGRSPFEPADTEKEEEEAQKWLKYMPMSPLVPGEDGKMRHYSAKQLFDELNRHLTERAVRSGYADNSIYDPIAIMALDEEGQRVLQDLSKIINAAGNQETVPEVKINPARPGNGASAKTHDGDEDKPKREKTEEEKKKEEWNKEKRSRMQILRAMSVRIPLLMYGAEVDDENTGLDINNFTTLFKGDRSSWDEFMPEGVTPEIFDKLRACYNPSVFRSAAKQIREYARDADTRDVEERIAKIAEVFSFFHNPDKETVLTPWRVVNMHMSDTLGGYTFFDDTFIDRPSHRLTEPRLVEQEGVTERVFSADSLADIERMRILELNSKTGLYPLYVTYSLYRARKKFYEDAQLIDDKKVVPDDRHIWDETLRENIFVVCKTEMARKITRRTLVGFRHNADGSDIAVNAIYPTWLVSEKELVDGKVMKMKDGEKPSRERKHRTDLVGVLRACAPTFERDIQSRQWWEKQLNRKLDKQSNDMAIKFNAVVGNPPYQIMDGGNSNSSVPIYNRFVQSSKVVTNGFLSLIMPARWFVGGKGLDQFREEMLNDSKIMKIFDYPNYREIFPNAEIAGGVCYFLRGAESSSTYSFYSCNGSQRNHLERQIGDTEVLVRDNVAPELISHIESLNINQGKKLSEVVSPRKPFGINGDYVPVENGVPCWFKQKIGKAFAREDDVKDSLDLINKWKLLIPYVPIAGQTDFSKAIGFYSSQNVRIAEPGEVCSETYIVVYASNTKQELEYFKSYLFTRIFRFLVLQKVASQHVTRECFSFVPDLGTYEKEYSDEILCEEWGISEDIMRHIKTRIKETK